MPLELLQTNITLLNADAVVSPSSPDLICDGGGVCGAIFAASDAVRLHKACRKIGYCAPGDAVITRSFSTMCKYIIHTSGPVWRGGCENEAALLRSCYVRSLDLARTYGLRSIAFPLISAGTYGYPRELAIETAVSAIGDWLINTPYDMQVYLTLFREPGSARYRAVRHYIDRRSTSPEQAPLRNIRSPFAPGDKHDASLARLSSAEEKTQMLPADMQFAGRQTPLTDSSASLRHSHACHEIEPDEPFTPFGESISPPDYAARICDEDFEEEQTCFRVPPPPIPPEGLCELTEIESLPCSQADSEPKALTERKSRRSSAFDASLPISGRLRNLLHQRHETFRDMLLRLIDERGLSDPEVYKRANLDRRLFSKIRSNPDYQPAKGTVLALSIALRLNLDQTTDLLRLAGFALSPSSKSDLIVEYFITREIYDIYMLNEMLFEFDLKLLGTQ